MFEKLIEAWNALPDDLRLDPRMNDLAEIVRHYPEPDLPVLIERCLTHSVQLLPYQQYSVIKQYELKKIPDDVVNKFDKITLEKYTNALFLCDQEMSRDWVEGHDILKTMGFVESRQSEGHRVYVSLKWEPNEPI